jgi:hypothetical protein
MVPQYEKYQYNLPAFSRPLLILSQHNEGEKREKRDAAIQFLIACHFPHSLPTLISITILVALLSAVR